MAALHFLGTDGGGYEEPGGGHAPGYMATPCRPRSASPTTTSCGERQQGHILVTDRQTDRQQGKLQILYLDVLRKINFHISNSFWLC